MNTADHPEYARYLRHQAAWQGCQEAVGLWLASNEPILVERYGLCWTYEAARSFVHSLTQLFQAYNQVLWEHFSYCRECGGQCCVVDASDVRAFDLIAIALLEESAPVLPARIERVGQACIYLATTNGRPHCSWPDAWRTIKCWSFYCLGSGPWPPDADLGKLYHAVTAELQHVMQTLLPEPLRRYEAVEQLELTAYLDDPVEFSNRLHEALAAIFVEPFRARYPFSKAVEALGIEQHATITPNIFLMGEDVLTFIAEAMTEIDESPPAPPGRDFSQEQLLADLEMLAWIVESGPANYRAQVEEMQRRYAQVPAGTLWYRMKEQLQILDFGF
jgi:hypothetical protein